MRVALRTDGSLRAVGAAVFALGLWQGIVWATNVPRFLLPGPLPVARALWDNAALLAHHGAVTALEVVLGLLIGGALGAATAVHLAASPVARWLVQPVLVMTQALPVFALAPLLTLWLGYGLESKVLMAVLIIYFPVTSSFLDGLLRTPGGWLDLAQVMNARPGAVLWRVRVPAAIPALASGLRLAAVYAPMGAVIGEWVGASRGLGYLMLLANGRVKTDLMFAALIVLALLTLTLHWAVGKAADRLQARHAP